MRLGTEPLLVFFRCTVFIIQKNTIYLAISIMDQKVYHVGISEKLIWLHNKEVNAVKGKEVKPCNLERCHSTNDK